MIARASRAVGPLRAGVEACPPRPSTRSSREVTPFSVTPIDADRRGHSRERLGGDRAALVDDEPRAGRRGARSSSTASAAAVPETSSLQPKDSQTSWAGVKSCSSRVSTASQIATSAPLSSRVPRPQIAPSWISAPNGGCCQGASSSTGTTSRWAISTTGRSALAPAQWKSSPWVSIAGQLEPLVQQRELARQLGDELVERGGVDLVRVAVGDRRDADQGLELADRRDRHAARL